MIDFSTIPIRTNTQTVDASWWNTIRSKLIEFTDAPSLTSYANTAAFVTAKGSAAAAGDYFYDTTDNVIKYYNGTAWKSIESQLNKVDATTAPTANEDSGDGYEVGSLWHDVTNDVNYICIDATVAAAVWTEIVGANSSQVMTKKTFNDEIVMQEISTPSNPASGYRSIYPKSDGKFYHLTDAGIEAEFGAGGVGGINHIDNGDAEADTTGWATYADAAGVSPVDGTGGSATTTWTRNTTSPLRGDGDFKLSKDAADRQGEGASYDFTIDKTDKASALTISFDCDASNANYSDGDVRVYIYDVTNAAVIEPSSTELLAGNGKFQAQFQSASDSTSYRLIFHVASTNATAYDLYFDNIIVGPSSRAFANPISDWQEYTLTIGGVTTAPTEGAGATKKAYWRRVGDHMEIRFEYAQSAAGTAGSGNYQFPLPSGYQIDGTKVDTTGVANGQSVGSGAAFDGTTSFITNMFISDPDKLRMFTNTGSVGSTIVALSNTTARIGFNASVPIAGWGSTIQVSDHDDGRLVALRYTGSSSSMTGTPSKVTFTTADFDTHSIYSAGTVTIPHSGKYKIMASFSTSDVAWSVGNNYNIYVYKNGSSQSVRIGVVEVARTDGFMIEINEVLDLVKGDTIEIYGATSTSVTLNGGYLTLESLSSSSAISASETIACRYTSNSGQTVNSTQSVFTYEDIDYDTHGAYNAGTGVWTCPASGKYSIFGQMATQDVAWSAGHNLNVLIQKNGSNITIHTYVVEVARTDTFYQSVKDILDLVKGDTIEIDVSCSVSVSAATNFAANILTIHRIGL